jgi:hypothetical protein
VVGEYALQERAGVLGQVRVLDILTGKRGTNSARHASKDLRRGSLGVLGGETGRCCKRGREQASGLLGVTVSQRRPSRTSNPSGHWMFLIEFFNRGMCRYWIKVSIRR